MFTIEKCRKCGRRKIEGSFQLIRIGRFRIRIWFAMARPKRHDWPPVATDEQKTEMWKNIFPPNGHYSHAYVIGPFEFELPDRRYRRHQKTLRNKKTEFKIGRIIIARSRREMTAGVLLLLILMAFTMVAIDENCSKALDENDIVWSEMNPKWQSEALGQPWPPATNGKKTTEGGNGK